MKKLPVFLVISIAVPAAFLAGRWSSGANDPAVGQPGRVTTGTSTAAMRNKPPSSGLKPGDGEAGKQAQKNDRLAKFKAMTSSERMAYVAKGALIYDGAEQSQYLCEILTVLNKEELQETTTVLGAAQNRGNFPAQIIWDTLWTQWGRVDPQGALTDFTVKPGKTRQDARFVMRGWLEQDPAAALAWAREPKNTFHEGAAAAMALRQEAGGDPQKLEAALQLLPPHSATVKDGLNDYFDLAGMGGALVNPADAYGALPPALKEAAWSVALARLIYTDTQSAVDWLTSHANDPGRDYASSARLVSELAREDPAGTAMWTAQLPADSNTGAFHPGIQAYSIWFSKNAAEAKAWIQTQPASVPWVAQIQSSFPREGGTQ